MGACVLTSKKGANICKYTLLWTNASPGSDFSAQTISLDLSSYDFIIIFIKGVKTYGNTWIRPHIVFKGWTNFMISGHSDNSAGSISRFISSVSDTGITFSNGQLGNSYAWNNVGVPYQIYGIKI